MDQKEANDAINGKNEGKHITQFFLFLITVKDNCQRKYSNNILWGLEQIQE